MAFLERRHVSKYRPDSSPPLPGDIIALTPLDSSHFSPSIQQFLDTRFPGIDIPLRLTREQETQFVQDYSRRRLIHYFRRYLDGENALEELASRPRIAMSVATEFMQDLRLHRYTDLIEETEDMGDFSSTVSLPDRIQRRPLGAIAWRRDPSEIRDIEERLDEQAERVNEAHNALMRDNIPLIISIVEEYEGKGDLTQLLVVGEEALRQALDTFDWRLGHSVKLHVRKRVRNAINKKVLTTPGETKEEVTDPIRDDEVNGRQSSLPEQLTDIVTFPQQRKLEGPPQLRPALRKQLGRFFPGIHLASFEPLTIDERDSAPQAHTRIKFLLLVLQGDTEDMISMAEFASHPRTAKSTAEQVIRTAGFSLSSALDLIVEDGDEKFSNNLSSRDIRQRIGLVGLRWNGSSKLDQTTRASLLLQLHYAREEQERFINSFLPLVTVMASERGTRAVSSRELSKLGREIVESEVMNYDWRLGFPLEQEIRRTLSDSFARQIHLKESQKKMK